MVYSTCDLDEQKYLEYINAHNHLVKPRECYDKHLNLKIKLEDFDGSVNDPALMLYEAKRVNPQGEEEYLSNDYISLIFQVRASLSRNRITILTGSAGTGKTTMLAYLLQYFHKHFPTIYLTSTTVLSLNVLIEKVASLIGIETLHVDEDEVIHHGYKNLSDNHDDHDMDDDHNAGKNSFWSHVIPKTINSLLHHKPNKQKSNIHKLVMETNYKPSANFNQLDYGLIVIDECSMLSYDLFDALLKHTTCPILMLGDIKQLGPVERNVSGSSFTVFNLHHEYEKYKIDQPAVFTLNHVYRNTGDVLSMCHLILENRYAEAKRKMKPLDLHKLKQIKPHQPTVLAYTNATVDEWNLKLLPDPNNELAIGTRLYIPRCGICTITHVSDAVSENIIRSTKETVNPHSKLIPINEIIRSLSMIQLFNASDEYKTVLCRVNITGVPEEIYRTYQVFQMKNMKTLCNDTAIKPRVLTQKAFTLYCHNSKDYITLAISPYTANNTSIMLEVISLISDTFQLECVKKSGSMNTVVFDLANALGVYLISPKFTMQIPKFQGYQTILYGHALTVHKSQGSTMDSVAIVYDDIMVSRDEKTTRELLYTACSRAVHTVYCLPKKPK